MKAEIRNENGVLKEIQKNGETISEPFDRKRFSGQSKNNLVSAIQNENWKEAFKITFEAMTGETVEEAMENAGKNT